MKTVIYKVSTFLLFLFFVLLTSCSSTQTTMYKPSDGGPGWKVNVIKKGGIPDEFICSINDSTVMSASFPFIGDSFDKNGTYRGKKVMMSGYRNTTENKDSDGKVTSTSEKYQIRVFIDDKLIDKFDF